jgi:hypothetical protein
MKQFCLKNIPRLLALKTFQALASVNLQTLVEAFKESIKLFLRYFVAAGGSGSHTEKCGSGFTTELPFLLFFLQFVKKLCDVDPE